MSEMNGGCHCGALRARLETAKPLDDLQVRACQCGFCRRHGVRTVTDAGGRVAIDADGGALSRYRFGQSVAEFLVCNRCGVYVAAYMERDGRGVATLNINTLEGNPFGDRQGSPADYSEESPDSRAARRLRMWTPATLELR